MTPVYFPESNFTFTKPSDMTDEQCSSLPVWKGDVQIEGGSFPAIVSKWKMSPEELAEANRNDGEVFLSITGQCMPPVSVFVGSPFEEQ